MSKDGLISTITTVRIKATAEAVREALLSAEWSWWRDGRILEWKKINDGGVSFILKPLAPACLLRVGLPAKLGIELSPAREESEDGRRKLVIPARFFADFAGKGRYEIVEADDGVVLRSCWDAVERKGLGVRLLPMFVFLAIHLGGEAGTLRWPFPHGTGFPGLLAQLEVTKNNS